MFKLVYSLQKDFHVSCGCGLWFKFLESHKGRVQFKNSAHVKSSVYSVITVICSLQACFQVVTEYIVWSCCIHLEVACDQVSRVPRCQEQQRILPVIWTLLSIKKLKWFLQILQAQIKRWKYAVHSVSHLLQVSHNLLCNPCLCLISKGPRWIGLWMIACTIGFSNGSWSVRIFLIVNLPCYLNQRNAGVIAQSGDFGMDQFVLWCLPDEDLSLEVIWFQKNEVRARFYLLTNFRQGKRSVNEWYNAVQAQVSLVKYPPETASILHRDIVWFFWKMRSLSPRPSMILILIMRSFQQARWGSLPYQSSCKWPPSGSS